MIDCGDLLDPADGQVSVSGTTTGGVATYSCNQGYGLTGLSTRTCGTDGVWNGTAPTCGKNNYMYSVLCAPL